MVQERLIFLHSYSTWQIVLIITLLLAFLIFSLVPLYRVGRWWKRGVLICLRALALGLCVFLAFQPGLETAKVMTVRDRVVILVDASESMTLPAYPAKKSRMDIVKAFLADASGLFESLKKDHDLEVYAFSDVARKVPLAGMMSIEARGKTTDIAAALADVGKTQGQSLGGVLLFSDGDDRGDIGRAFGSRPAGNRLPFSPPAPIVAFCPGDRASFKDIDVREVKSGGFGFNKTPMEILVRVRAYGYSMRVPVVLRKEGEIIASKPLDLSQDKHDYEIPMSFVPQEAGKSIYSVEVPPLADEAATSNNLRRFVVNVIRDKTRILQIAGRPSWDERFLRQMLKNDPNIDLVSFMILRTPSSLVSDIRNIPIPLEEISLIPFPAVDIFAKGLPGFDIVIFQNFDYRPYVSFQYLDFLRDYVNKGGAFIMTGGEQSFSSGGFGGTPVEEILPVALERVSPFGGPEGASREEFSLIVTHTGADHPVMKLDPDRRRNEKAWSSAPRLSGFNRVRGTKPGAMVLAEGPGSTPIISVMEAGRGRTLAIATESLWRWAFSPGGARLARTFWKNAISWLVKDPTLRRIQVRTEKDSYQKDEAVSLEVAARDAAYRPVKGAQVEIEMLSPSRSSSVLKAEEKGDGRYHVQFMPKDSGVYQAKVRVRTSAAGKHQDLSDGAETAFTVEGRSAELDDLSVNEDLMRELAELSGGQYVTLPHRAGDMKIAFPPPAQVRTSERERRPIWDSPVFYLPAVFLLCIEWFLRRRWGLA